MSLGILIGCFYVLQTAFLLPLKDNRPQRRGFPWMTATLVAINTLIHIAVALWLTTQTVPDDQPPWLPIYPFMQVPQLILDGEGLGALSSLTAMFLHGDWSHLIGNMFFLWFFGRKVEDLTGSMRFGLFYLLVGFASGLISVVANILFFPATTYIPGLGASGAISGVMGAYLFLYWDEHITTLVAASLQGCLIPFPWPVKLPAWVFLVYSFLKDALLGQIALELVEIAPEFFLGVGVFAHMGGVVTGLIFIFLFLHPEALAYRRG
jgi:membrane associated rhomboid family serine protease